jgi:polyhydroxyalkanoate synthesis regulator phasin
MKSFVVETRIDGKVKRITLGKYGAITVEEARKQAKNLLGQIARGDNPIAEKKSNKIKLMTLDSVLNDYLKARKDLKEFTVTDYRNVLRQVMSDWLSKPLISITREMISKRHAEYGVTNSKARSNYDMRVLRAVFNFAVHEYQLESGQPGHIMEPRKAMLKVAELSGVTFTVHDLRRTFATTAESLDLPAYALKRLLNHKMTHDVTAGYIMRDVERLRKPMQRISDYLIRQMAGSLETVDEVV